MTDYTIIKDDSIRIQISSFKKGNGTNEYHLLIGITNPSLSYSQQTAVLQQTYAYICREKLPGAQVVFRRYFLSDAANQTDLLMEHEDRNPLCALSVVQQAPLNGTKIALWAYLQTNVETRLLSSGLFEVSHNNYRHLWEGNAHNRAANSEYQTRLLLNDYVFRLAKQNCTLASHCIRTWFFVQNVDINYAGVVKARKEVFVTQGLTEKTHYISSTGIEGRHADPSVLVQMDSYAVEGLKPEQIRFLYAPSHLNPTYEYGVTFERGTAVSYGDRKQIFISGTASIDNQGEIVHPGDVLGQARRMMENIGMLLQEAEATTDDIVQAIVYLRDNADYQAVNAFFEAGYPRMPHLIVHAPVCRPGWLIETECIAVIPIDENSFLPL